MPVPSTMADLSQTAGSNYPVGSEPIGNNLDNYLRSHAAIIKSTNSVASASMASGSTVNVANANGEHVQITGTATISSLGQGFVGCRRELRFAGACTLTHSSSLQLQGAQNATTAAGDVFTFRCIGNNTWVQTGKSTAATNFDPSAFVTVAGNQDITGTKRFLSTSGSAVIIERMGAEINSVIELRTSAGSVYAGQGGAGYFDIGSGGDLSNSVNRWARFSPTGLEVAGSSVVLATRSISAGNGLTGGGNLSDNRTLSLGTPSTLTPTTTNSVTGSSHTHNITGFANLSTDNVFSGSLEINSLSNASRTLTIKDGINLSGGLQMHSTGQFRVFNNFNTIALRPRGRDDATNQFLFGTDGVAVGLDWSATSDERLKKNIRSTYGRRELIEALRLCRYEWKADGRSAVGVIAQEVQKLAPEYVHEGEDGMLSVDKASLALEAVMALAELQGVR